MIECKERVSTLVYQFYDYFELSRGNTLQTLEAKCLLQIALSELSDIDMLAQQDIRDNKVYSLYERGLPEWKEVLDIRHDVERLSEDVRRVYPKMCGSEGTALDVVHKWLCDIDWSSME